MDLIHFPRNVPSGVTRRSSTHVQIYAGGPWMQLCEIDGEVGRDKDTERHLTDEAMLSIGF